MLADKPIGQWNQFHIRQIGARTTVYLNDILVVDNAIMENFWDRDSPLFAPARSNFKRMAARSAGATFGSRNSRPKKQTSGFAEHEGQAFASLFNGVDLTGWQGSVENYEVVDGAIRCKEGKGGMLLTEKEYGKLHRAS